MIPLIRCPYAELVLCSPLRPCAFASFSSPPTAPARRCPVRRPLERGGRLHAARGAIGPRRSTWSFFSASSCSGGDEGLRGRTSRSAPRLPGAAAGAGMEVWQERGMDSIVWRCGGRRIRAVSVRLQRQQQRYLRRVRRWRRAGRIRLGEDPTS